MSHLDILNVYSKDFYNFIQISNDHINIYGRQMITILIASISYSIVLFIFLRITWMLYKKHEEQLVRSIALAAVLLIISFFMMEIYAINCGYSNIENRIAELKKEKTFEKTTLRWIWK